MSDSLAVRFPSLKLNAVIIKTSLTTKALFTVTSILQKVTATAAGEIIRHLEEENKILRLKLHQLRMEKMLISTQ